MQIYVENQRGIRYLISEGWSTAPTYFDNDYFADLLVTFPASALDQIYDRFLAQSAPLSPEVAVVGNQDSLITDQFPGAPFYFTQEHRAVYAAVRQHRLLIEEAPLAESTLDDHQSALRHKIRMVLQKIVAEERAEAARIQVEYEKRSKLGKLTAEAEHLGKGLGQAVWNLGVWAKDVTEVAMLVSPTRLQTQMANAAYDYAVNDISFEQSATEHLGRVKKEIVDVLGFDPSTITAEQLEQAFQIAHLVYDDDGLRADIGRFAKDYVSAQHRLEIAEFAGAGVFEIILTVVLAAFTGGVGGAAAMAKNARLMFRFREVGDLILDFAKHQKQRLRLKKSRGAKSETAPLTALDSEDVTVTQSSAPEPAPAKSAKGKDGGANKQSADQSEGKKATVTDEKDASNDATGANGAGKTTQCNGKACESGEPINLKTGEERLTLVDSVLDGPLPLTVARTYRSSNHKDSGMGVGWSHTLNEQLVVKEKAGVVDLYDAEGRVISLPLPGCSGQSHNVVEQLTLTKYADDHWAITPYGAPQGIQKHFRIQEKGDTTPLLSEIRDGYDNFHRFHYVRGQLICIESSLGEALHISPVDGRIGELKKETRDGQIATLASYEYSPEGDLVRATDANGHSEHYEYTGHLIKKRTLKSGYSFQFRWDDTGPGARCVRQWGDPIDGRATYDYTFVWDDDGKGVAVTDTRGGTERYRFNDRALPIYYRDAEGAETLYSYNELGQTTSVQLPAEEGVERGEKLEYDALGRLIAKTDASGGVQKIEYNPAGQPAKITDAAGRLWQREYNEKGQVTASIDPLGQITRYTYNPIGLIGSITNPLEQTTRYLWNPQGKLTAVHDAAGRSQHYRYDIAQRLVEVQHGPDIQTRYEYDAQDRISAIIAPDGGRTEYQYNPQGLVSEITDPEGRSTQYHYDGLSQVKKRTNPDGSQLEYRYDGERNLVGLINEKGEQYQLKYDLRERLTEEVGFDGRVTRYAYNKAGHLIASRAVTDLASGKGVDTLYERDTFGRLLQEITPDGTTSYRYNRAGQMTEAENAHRKLRWDYDAGGRLIGDWQDNAEILHSYDSAGNRIATRLPSGEELTYGYNEVGQFQSLHARFAGTEAATLLASINRDALGREIAREHGNGLTTNSSYDPQGRLQSLRVGKFATDTDKPVENPLLERSYGYNRSGQLTQINDSLRGNRSYHYDALDRLTQVDGPSPEHFVHDPAHNILAAAGSAEEAQQQASSTQVNGNRLQFRGDTHYEYDIHGNRTAALRGKSQKLQTRYRYNSKHQLVAIAQYKVDDVGEPQLQSETQYQYDPLGRRVRKQGQGTTTEFLWNGDVLLQEATRDSETSQDLKSRIYYFEPETFKPVALSEDGEVYQYHLDHLGTPDTLTNAEGDVVWSVSYKTYGNLAIAHREEIAQPIRFQGQYFDEESGLHYNRFRFYDPALGSFANQDPIGLQGGINIYSYAPNPVTWTDPYGLSCKENQWNVFQQRSKGVFANSSQAAEGYQLWKNQEWEKLQELLGPKAWPPNRGAVNVRKQPLKPGDQIDRYGGWTDDLGFHDKGTFVSPVGESFPSRALPDSTLEKPYKQYVVVEEFDVESSPAIPWFGQPGMGTQYELPATIDDLLDAGIIAPK
ncbi:RHS repeat-associated core domain-containing protein [uncultured Microbulbifer sp.]|uniref:RHS repeat-associated core domain-containing protein n=1 Tax=uncultured Microbulbifer sp. TaxID=348147 RepID=UPI00260982DF|nr:RHS repeat-associated core domain-containing protein [uncultured Microbulbifer sp.]